MTPEKSYLAIVSELQALATRLPRVTQQDVLEVASMHIEDLRRRALIARDWHGHFAHSLDGIKEIAAMPGAGIDGCRTHKEVRSIVEQLVAHCPVTWEDDYRGRPKATVATVTEDDLSALERFVTLPGRPSVISTVDAAKLAEAMVLLIREVRAARAASAAASAPTERQHNG